jgi:hypothetical protein
VSQVGGGSATAGNEKKTVFRRQLTWLRKQELKSDRESSVASPSWSRAARLGRVRDEATAAALSEEMSCFGKVLNVEIKPALVS